MHFQTLILSLAAFSLAECALIQRDGDSPLWHPGKGHHGNGGGHHGGGRGGSGGHPVCGGKTVAECCQTDALGIVDATCHAAGTPTSLSAFRQHCSKTGLTPACCQLGAGGVAALCQAAK